MKSYVNYVIEMKKIEDFRERYNEVIGININGLRRSYKLGNEK